jgi:hypothetical protein
VNDGGSALYKQSGLCSSSKMVYHGFLNLKEVER